MLSVSGMRGLIGQSLTPPVAARFGAAFGSWLADQHDRPPRVVLGRDSRPSGTMIENAVAAGLLATGCEVVRVGVLSTPGIAVMIETLEADGGMAVTASHNPLPWNGIKALRADAVAPPPDQAQQIIDHFKNDTQRYAAVEAIQTDTTNDAGCATHVERVLELVDADLIRNAKLSCVVDSVHGAGGDEARLLLDRLGVAVDHLYAEPTGLFPHTPEPTKDNLTELAQRVANTDADVGFAQDPDADRLAIVDEAGTYIGEEYTLALCTLHALEPGGVVAANLSTSRMVDDIAGKAGGSVVRTPVGEANVAAAMRQRGSKVGGEGNGGIILPAISQVRDSVVGIALILEMLAKRKQPLSDIVRDIPAYAIVKDKVSIEGLALDDINAKLLKTFADQRIDTQDGVRIDWDDKWVHVRPSNTEPILRLIAEARTEADANDLLDRAKACVGT